ncbi:hypothetical protein Ciccas_003801 [Cichlidogyrus casuarinus]|uniref:Fibronectin type-III domain-containing protein n=1 Tax=Cichlidogyrus casuarinus TaxID=1844966 RepID=A0ABD2QGN9_9PLAT
MKESRTVDCWLSESCPVSQYAVEGVEPPTDCNFRSVGDSSGSVDIKWRRQAFGSLPANFIVHAEDPDGSDKKNISVEVEKVGNAHVWGEIYTMRLTNLLNSVVYLLKVVSVTDSKVEVESHQCAARVKVGAS